MATDWSRDVVARFTGHLPGMLEDRYLIDLAGRDIHRWITDHFEPTAIHEESAVSWTTNGWSGTWEVQVPAKIRREGDGARSELRRALRNPANESVDVMWTEHWIDPHSTTGGPLVIRVAAVEPGTRLERIYHPNPPARPAFQYASVAEAQRDMVRRVCAVRADSVLVHPTFRAWLDAGYRAECWQGSGVHWVLLLDGDRPVAVIAGCTEEQENAITVHTAPAEVSP